MRSLLGGMIALLVMGFAPWAEAGDATVSGGVKVPAVKVAQAGFVPTWLLKATLYHSSAKGVGTRDSLGCKVVPMRTVAIDPTVIPRRTVLFIAETVGLPLPNGKKHDGYWYASDTGGAIKGKRIDLYTGANSGSMKGSMGLNLKKVTVVKAGAFKGCPKG